MTEAHRPYLPVATMSKLVTEAGRALAVAIVSGTVPMPLIRAIEAEAAADAIKERDEARAQVAALRDALQGVLDANVGLDLHGGERAVEVLASLPAEPKDER